jgi:hypothetical protein
MLLISSLTVCGQFTPQRLVINGKSGVFLTPEEERAVLSALVELRYCSNSAILKDSIIYQMEKSIEDKKLEINLLTSENNKHIEDAKSYAKSYNLLLEEYNEMTGEYVNLKLKYSKSINWNIGLACSTLLLGTLFIITR